MNIDLTQILVSFIAIIPVLLQMKKDRANSDNKHAEQLRVSRSAQQQTQRQLESINQRLDTLERKEDANNLQTARIDLRQALQHSPDNIPAVLELARIYFLNLHGNADLGRKFLAWVKNHHVQEWADVHDEDIANLIEAATHST